MWLLENSYKEFMMKNSILPQYNFDAPAAIDQYQRQPPNRYNPDVEMWRDAYLKEYHSHMLTFKVLRQAEYDLDIAKKEIEYLKTQLSNREKLSELETRQNEN